MNYNFKILMIGLQIFALLNTLIKEELQTKAGLMFAILSLQAFILFGIIYWL